MNAWIDICVQMIKLVLCYGRNKFEYPQMCMGLETQSNFPSTGTYCCVGWGGFVCISTPDKIVITPTSTR